MQHFGYLTYYFLSNFEIHRDNGLILKTFAFLSKIIQEYANYKW